MPQYEYFWEGGPKFLQSENFRFGTDSVLLGNYANLSGVKNGIDLGCASGVLTLLSLARSSTIHMTGLELNREAAELARQNVEQNGYGDRGNIICGDIRDCRKLFPSGSFDLVMSNPPYFPAASGTISPRPGRAEARGEITCSLKDLCAAAKWLCRWDGKAVFVHRQERLAELLSTMSAYGLEPKRMRLVCHTFESPPSLVLVEGRRGGKPGMKVEPCLFLKTPDGEDTEEVRKIYHRI